MLKGIGLAGIFIGLLPIIFSKAQHNTNKILMG